MAQFEDELLQVVSSVFLLTCNWDMLSVKTAKVLLYLWEQGTKRNNHEIWPADDQSDLCGSKDETNDLLTAEHEGSKK